MSCKYLCSKLSWGIESSERLINVDHIYQDQPLLFTPSPVSSSSTSSTSSMSAGSISAWSLLLRRDKKLINRVVLPRRHQIIKNKQTRKALEKRRPPPSRLMECLLLMEVVPLKNNYNFSIVCIHIGGKKTRLHDTVGCFMIKVSWPFIHESKNQSGRIRLCDSWLWLLAK